MSAQTMFEIEDRVTVSDPKCPTYGSHGMIVGTGNPYGQVDVEYDDGTTHRLDPEQLAHDTETFSNIVARLGREYAQARNGGNMPEMNRVWADVHSAAHRRPADIGLLDALELFIEEIKFGPVSA